MDFDEDAKTIGRRVRQIRYARRKSLAVVAGLAGISVGHLSRIERGERALDRRSVIVALAGALDVAPTELTSLPVPAPADGGADVAVNAVRGAIQAVTMGVPNGQPQPVEQLSARVHAVEREIQFRDRAGRETTLRSRRFVSMAAGETTTESTTVSTSVNQLNFDALYLSHFASCGVSSASPAAAPWAAGWRSAVDAGAVLAGCLDGCRVWASGEGPLGVPPRWLPVARGLLTRSAGYVRARRAQLRKIQNLRLGVVVSGSAAWM